jgi:transcriptional regulator with XRE-family HTH domain
LRGTDDLVALAEDSGVPVATLFRITNGVAAAPKIATLQAIAAALGVPFEEVDAAVQASRQHRHG